MAAAHIRTRCPPTFLLPAHPLRQGKTAFRNIPQMSVSGGARGWGWSAFNQSPRKTHNNDGEKQLQLKTSAGPLLTGPGAGGVVSAFSWQSAALAFSTFSVWFWTLLCISIMPRLFFSLLPSPLAFLRVSIGGFLPLVG